MQIEGFIVKNNEKGKSETGVNNRYQNIIIQLDEKTDLEELKHKGFSPKTFKERHYLTCYIVSVSKVNQDQLTNEFGGVFDVEKAKNGVVFVKSAKLTNVFE